MVQPNGSLCANNHCSIRYEQIFRHNKHTHTNQKAATDKLPGTIIKFIANYIKGRKAYTTYRTHTAKQRQFKTGVPQGGVLSPTLFNIYTSDLNNTNENLEGKLSNEHVVLLITDTILINSKLVIDAHYQHIIPFSEQGLRDHIISNTPPNGLHHPYRAPAI